MALLPGTRIGAYEIVSLVGAGGMGEVYRARDMTLGRDVAIKVVADAFNRDPGRLARFRSEAQLLAALNHPHIATIHGFEEADGNHFLVMELVEGETLADRLKSGALPINEALGIARQVADALQAAHDKGIIHRDLKPANIALGADGRVKVLDFGLAKVMEGGAATDLSVSPTLSLAFTQGGVIVGTAAYMAPEQARGKPVDKRADIWAFGCVLYEMLTGRRAFDGDDAAVVLASVIKSEPDWSALPTNVPPAVVTLLRGCLEKERRNRVSDIGAATFVLDHASQLVAPAVVATTVRSEPASSLWRRALLVVSGVVIGALIAAGVVWQLSRPASPPVVRMVIPTVGSTVLAPQGADRDVAITPDGSRIIYRGNNQLLVRSLNQLEPTALTNIGAPRGVFVSPDDQWVGFFDAAATLKKVAITGGPAVTLTTLDGGGARGATWGPDDTIIFATNQLSTGLQRISAAGGTPEVLTRPDQARGEGDHLWPEFLPDGKSVLFTIVPSSGGAENAQIAALDLQTMTTKVLARGGSHAHYVPTGHLVYGVAGTLRAVAFDVRRMEVVGAPTPVLQGVVTTLPGAADVAIAANGSLVYVPGSSGNPRVVVASADRQGNITPLPGIPPDIYRDVRVSPDGTRLAIGTQADVWAYDLSRATLSRLTTDPGNDSRPLWTTDGQRVIFSSARSGSIALFSRKADGSGTDEPLLKRATGLLDLRADGFSPDGKRFIFTEVFPGAAKCVVEEAPWNRPSEIRVLISTNFCDDWGTVSPDGQWIAYQSDLSGRSEIYVERYPDLGGRQQISTEGGVRPVWSRDGNTLYFSSNNYRQMLAVRVASGPTLKVSKAQVALQFEGGPLAGVAGARPYDVSPDGKFYIIRAGQTPDGGTSPSLVLIEHWTEELKRLVPVK